ncbi:MAG: flagellar basal body-associated FliL family protein [Dehalococcoidia bacterium]|nr:flagellar basal body-associated FliL family protein [Dehalococcoidia bacterium]
MKKPIILAVGGAVVGIAVAFALFTFVLGGSGEVAPTAEPTVVSVPGKLGPHITLADRVFNLRTDGGSQIYLKLQTVIEFETMDGAWAHVLTGCGASAPHGADLRFAGDLMVSAVPAGQGAPRIAEAGASEDPCVAEQKHLLAEFEKEIGTGRQLLEDAITTIVTGHTPEELGTTEGKEALKAEILHAAEEIFHGEPRPTRVLFLNFITQ